MSMIVRSRIIPGVGITVAALMLAAVATRAVNADARFTKAGSDAFHRKLATIVQGGVAPTASTAASKGNGAKQTPILENELNSYLRYELREEVPAGVTEPTITIVGDGRVTGSAVLDLDAVKQSASVDLVVRSHAPVERQASGHRERRPPDAAGHRTLHARIGGNLRDSRAEDGPAAGRQLLFAQPAES